MTVSTKVRPAQGEKARKRETAPKGERADGGNAGWPVSVPDWTSGVEAWLALQQRSLEALAEIGNLAARAMQAIAEEQVEAVTGLTCAISSCAEDIGTARGLDQIAARQGELAHAVVDQGFGCLHAIASHACRCQTAAAEVATRRLGTALADAGTPHAGAGQRAAVATGRRVNRRARRFDR